MGNKKQIFAIAVIFGLVLICRAAFVSGANDTIKFKHAPHEDSECKVCHSGAIEDSGLFKVLPKKKPGCSECHDVEAKDQCTTCHTDPESATTWPKTQRKTNFLHSTHKKALGDCKKCHGADPDLKPGFAGDHNLCGTCHKSDIDNMLCAKCHRGMASAGLSKLSGYSHKDNFLKEHGEYARQNTRVCAQCHTQTFCIECHDKKKSGIKPSFKYPEKVSANFIHRGDWITLHRIEAKTGELMCLKCHAKTDCSSCHQQKGISSKAKNPDFKHPAGWVANHGTEARENITTCAACHEGDRGPGYCANCHKPAAGGKNPHPSGFNGFGRMSESDRMCKECHGK